MMFSKIKSLLDGKKILILGFGREGRSTLDFLEKYVDAQSVTIADFNEVSDIDAHSNPVMSGADYQKNLTEFDVIIKSPGIVYENPTEEILVKTTSQTSLFLLEFKDRTVGITGTKGKSTTTTLVHHVLSENGFNAVLLGNIGIPPLSCAHKMLDSNAVAIFEMSCHQLEFEASSPHVAVILNLFEDHLDHYKTREKYVQAKRNIYKNQTETDLFVCNSDCKFEINESVAKTVTVGAFAEVEVFENGFSYFDKKIFLKEDSSRLCGYHNVYNIAVAYTVASYFGVLENSFMSALATYKPLAHRLEYVKTVNGVLYYDDSISTVCQTTIQAITSFDNVQTVIIGGMDRGIDYTVLVEFLKERPVENIILAYESGVRISKMLDEAGISYFMAKDLEDAVDISVRVSRSGTRAMLSPAAASYGYFKNFEHRGDMFREYLDKY